jgi:MoxR-like ATPase
MDSRPMNTARPYIDVSAHAGVVETLLARDGLPEVQHKFDDLSLHAINAALAAERPLLVRGEPGTGKSQLARAAAQLLGRAFVWRVVDAQTQVSDFFYTFDAVERLAQAQVAGALRNNADSGSRSIEATLDERNFVRPGPLWWAFDAAGARVQQQRYTARCAASGETTQGAVGAVEDTGHVVLIDEIDKTDSSVPNGLLEALGQGTFAVPRGNVSLHDAGPAPLVVITTNEERELPSAFVRRCMVLHILVPTVREELVDWLTKRGQAHFVGLSPSLLMEAANLLVNDRVAAQEQGLTPPGQAEYLDLLRAVTRLRTTEAEQAALLKTIAGFALKKHPELARTDGRR